MTRLLLDTSVVIKWFHNQGEAELAEARALRDAHVRGTLTAHVLDLGLYEVGNVLIRALTWAPDAVAEKLDDLLTIVGPPLSMSPAWLRRAAHLAHANALSCYDASWAAAALELGVPLVTADHRLLRAGLAESPAQVCTRLQIAL